MVAEGARSVLAVLTATDRELEAFEKICRHNRRLEAFVTGVGKAQAALAASDVLADRRFAGAILFGCGGSYESGGLQIGDVVVATESIFGDEGVETEGGFLTLEDLGLPMTRRDSGEPIFHRIAATIETYETMWEGRNHPFAVKRGRVLTVSTGSGSRRRAARLERLWQPMAEAMEGAAVALAALRHGIPFVEVRGISNATGVRHREEWNVDLACENAARIVANIAEFDLRKLA